MPQFHGLPFPARIGDTITFLTLTSDHVNDFYGPEWVTGVVVELLDGDPVVRVLHEIDGQWREFDIRILATDPAYYPDRAVQ